MKKRLIMFATLVNSVVGFLCLCVGDFICGVYFVFASESVHLSADSDHGLNYLQKIYGSFRTEPCHMIMGTIAVAVRHFM